jgi:hypothetical protein
MTCAVVLLGIGPTPASAAPTYSGPFWIISARAVAALGQAGLSPSLTDFFFNNSRTFLVGNSPGVATILPNALPVRSFTSYATMQAAFATGAVSPKTRAVMYDPEDWTQTPLTEQRSPALYAGLSDTLAHQHGMGFIYTPSVDILAASGVPVNAMYSDYLSWNIPGQGSRSSDMFNIQAQHLIASPSYQGFVTSAAMEARAASSTTYIMAGLSTNPLGQAATPQDLWNAYTSTRLYVNGYWLNVPGTSSYCPSCGTPHPEVAIGFLQMLAPTLGEPG